MKENQRSRLGIDTYRVGENTTTIRLSPSHGKSIQSRSIVKGTILKDLCRGGRSERYAWLYFLVAAALLAILSPAHAEEGGAGHYAPGTTATLIDLPPTKPGFIVEGMYLGFWGSASASRPFPLGGQVTAGLDANVSAITVGGLYTFAAPMLGAFYSLGVFAPVIDETVTAQVTGPLGRSITRTDHATGLGDVTLIPAMFAWKRGDFQVSAILSIYAPTGAYKVGELANVGLNYWTVDPTISVSYNGSKNGLNAAIFAGVTFNSENGATNYRSGSAIHVEGSVQQLFPVGKGLLGLGANAWAFEQITDDSGVGASLGPFRGSSIGVGPVVSYVLPLGSATAVIEARWLPEIETRNRVKGDFFWTKAVLQF
jgi:hypothetical protein